MLLSAAAVLVVVLAFELVARVYLSFLVGPDMLLYGLADRRVHVVHDVAEHGDERAGYSKYFPSQKRSDYDKITDERFDVAINASGFRGEDFPADKAAEVVRIVTLGASSTFGYHAPDDETYPMHLERYLNRHCDAPLRFEVLNLGIPHLNSREVAALFLEEGIPLQPDIATLYLGANDAAWAATAPSDQRGPGSARTRLSALRALHVPYLLLRNHLILGLLADRATRPVDAARLGIAQVDALLGDKPERLVASLERLRRDARAADVLLIASNQQVSSGISEREARRGLSYEAERRAIRRGLTERGSVSWLDARMLHHAELMKSAEQWALERDVPFVDNIDALDGDRNELVSWVHLSPRGNELLARSFGDEILRQVCAPADADPGQVPST